MARSAKTTTRALPATPVVTARTVKARGAKSAAAPVTGKTARAASKLAPGRGKAAAAPVIPVAPARVAPPSKGELRAQIERLETANATMKAKGREANRAAKVAARRIAELEEQVSQLEAAATKTTIPIAAPMDAKPARRGGPPGPNKPIDPGDAVPPGVAVQEPEPLDEEAATARDALEDHLSGE